mmetsp:Transcript_3627/g.6322  ORF Transcript_3627/g.6322 Transcript_3627/m.6322 type:complete len:167 (-) Transcript_3627:133-633(-)
MFRNIFELRAENNTDVTMVNMNTCTKKRKIILGLAVGLAIMVGLTTLAPASFAGVMGAVFKIKVLPLDEYVSLKAELEKTRKELEVLIATDKMVKKEASANFQAYKEAKQHKIAAEEQNAEAMLEVSKLEAKMAEMEDHMAEAKAFAAESINKMDSFLRGSRAEEK